MSLGRIGGRSATSVRQRARPSRLYVPFLLRRLTLDASSEGYPDWPGRASSKEGES